MGKAISNLISAADSGDVEAVRQLLAGGADVNGTFHDGLTALMAAAGSGHVPVIELLVASGADVNAADDHGLTALMMAASRGRVEAVRSLLEIGADVHARSTVFPFEGQNALALAAKNGSAEVIGELLARGADANAQDADAETPLMKAAFWGNKMAVERLLQAKADASIKNYQGKTARMIADEIGQTNIAAVLGRLEHRSEP